MTRDELAGRPVHELVDLLLQQQALVEQLQAHVAELETQVQTLTDRNCSASVARRLTHSLRSGRFAESRATTAKPTRFAVG